MVYAFSLQLPKSARNALIQKGWERRKLIEGHCIFVQDKTNISPSLMFI